jgi:hypothetical protein
VGHGSRRRTVANARYVKELLTPLVEAGRIELAGILADVLDDLGEYGKAEVAYREATRAGDPAALNDYAMFLVDHDRIDEAIPVAPASDRRGGFARAGEPGTRPSRRGCTTSTAPLSSVNNFG